MNRYKSNIVFSLLLVTTTSNKLFRIFIAPTHFCATQPRSLPRISSLFPYQHLLAVDDVQTVLRRIEFAALNVVIRVINLLHVCLDCFHSRRVKFLQILKILPSVSTFICGQRTLRNIYMHFPVLFFCEIRIIYCWWRWIKGIKFSQPGTIVERILVNRCHRVWDGDACQLGTAIERRLAN